MEPITIVAPTLETADSLVQRASAVLSARAASRDDGRWDVVLLESGLLESPAESHELLRRALAVIQSWADDASVEAPVAIGGRRFLARPHSD